MVTMAYSTHSHFAYMDIPMIVFVLLVVLLCFKYLEKHKRSVLFWASFIGGLAISTKYNAALPVLIVILICHIDNISKVYKGEKSVEKALKYLFSKSLIISIFLIVLGFFLVSSFIIRKIW